METLIRIVECQSTLKKSGAGGAVGKLIIAITQKDVCYGTDTWDTLVQTLAKHYEQKDEDMSSHMLALVLKLALCCANQVEQKTYKEDVAKAISEGWSRFIPVLFAQVERGRPQSYLKILGILFLLHTILKQNNEVALNQAFISAFLQAQNRSALIDGFLRVHALLGAEASVLKLCHGMIMSILLGQGKEPESPPEMVAKADMASGVPKLFVLCEAVEKEEQLLSLESFLSIERDEINKPLLEKLLQNPRALAYKEESKTTSLNYYLSTMLRMMSAKTSFAMIAEDLQEALAGFLQCYLRLDCSRGADLGELIYHNAVNEMYIIFLDFHLSSGAVLPDMAQTAELLNRTGDHILCSIEGLIQGYFAAALPGENEALVGLLKDLFLLGGDLSKITQAAGVPAIDISHLANVCQKSTLVSINSRIAQDNLKYTNPYQWVVTIIESHMATHTKCKSASVLHLIEKAILSDVQLMFSILPLYFRFYSSASPSAKQFMIKLFLRSESVGLPAPLGTNLSSSALEMFRTVDLPSEQCSDLHSASFGLLLMSKIAGALRGSILPAARLAAGEVAAHATRLLLDKWEIEFAVTARACAEGPDIRVYAREISGYDFTDAVKDICQFFDAVPAEPESMGQMVDILLKCAEDVAGEALVQQQLLRTDPRRLQQLLGMPDPLHRAHSLLSRVNVGCLELQHKLFRMLAEGVMSHRGEDEELVKMNLTLLGEIVTSNRPMFITALVDEIMPWVAKCAGERRLQEIMLLYLAWLCYEGLTVRYPQGERTQDNTADIVKEVIEGYGVPDFKRNEQPIPKGQCCSCVRGRRRPGEQAFYHCYSCGLVDSKVCCSVCARVCHKGHNVGFVGNAMDNCECRSAGRCKAIPSLRGAGSLRQREYRMYRRYLASGQGRYRPFSQYREEQMRRGRSSYIAHLIERQMRDEQNPEGNGSGDDQAEIVDIDVLEERPERNTEILEIPDEVESSEDIVIGEPEQEQEGSDIISSLSESKNEEEGHVPAHSSDVHCEQAPVSPSLPRMGSDVSISCKNELTGPAADKVWAALFTLIRDLLTAEARAEIDKLVSNSLFSPIKSTKSSFPDPSKLVRPCDSPCSTSTLCSSSRTIEVTAQGQPPRRSRPWIPSDSPANVRSYLGQTPAARNLVSSNHAGVVAIADRDSVNIFVVDASSVSGGEAESEDKYNPAQTERIAAGFQVCGLQFNEANDSYLAVAGVKDCVVHILDPKKGTQVSKLKVDLMLQSLGEGLNIVKVRWLPGSQTMLAVAAHTFIKVYDLSKDNISPVYTLTSGDGPINDMVIVKESKSEYRFVVCINESTIGNLVVDIPDAADRLSSGGVIDIADTVTYTEPLAQFLEGTKVVTIHYSSPTGLLFFALDNGKAVYGSTDPTNRTLRSVAQITFGEGTKTISSIQDIVTTETAVWLTGLVNNGSQLSPVVLKLDEAGLSLQRIRGRAEDLHVFRNVDKKTYVSFLTDSSALVLFGAAEWEGKSVRPALTLEGPVVSKVISRAKLPTSVSMPVDFFEAATNVTSTSALEKNVALTGSIIDRCHKDEDTIHSLLTGRLNSPIVASSPATLQIGLRDDAYVFAGLRVVADSTAKLNVSVFNRKVQTGQNLSQVTDIPFCDAEILSLAEPVLQLSIEAEGENIKLNGVEVYVMPKDKFCYYEKLSRLENLLLEKAPQKFAKLSQHAKLTQTSALKVLPWLEKSEQLAKVMPDAPAALALVSALDFASAVAYSSARLPPAAAKELLALLQGYMHVGIEDGIRLHVVRSAARRCAKAVIYNLAAKEIRYSDYKARALIDYVEGRMRGTVGLQVLEKYMLHLNKTARRRTDTLGEWLRLSDKSPKNIVAELGATLLLALQDHLSSPTASEPGTDEAGKAKRALEQYARLLLVYHDALCSQPAAKPEDVQTQIYACVAPCMTHPSEMVKSVFAEALLQQAQTHDSAMQESVPAVSPMLLRIAVRIVESESAKDATRTNAAISLCYRLLERHTEFSKEMAPIIPELLDRCLAKLNRAQTSQARTALLVLAMLTRLMEVSDISSSMEKPRYRPKTEGADTLLPEMMKCGGLVPWLRSAIAGCYGEVRARYGAEDSMAMQDVAETRALLKVQHSESPELWSFFFNSDEAKKGELWTNLPERTLAELFLLCFDLAACDKSCPCLEKLLGYPQLVQDIKLDACVMLVTQGIPASLLSAAKKVLSILSKSQAELQEYKDSYEYQNNLSALTKYCEPDKAPAAYRCLQTMWKIAEERTGLWKNYVKQHGETYRALFQLANSSNAKVAFYAVALVCLALESDSSESFSIKRTLGLFNCTTGKFNENAENFWELSLGDMKAISDLQPYDEDTFALALAYGSKHLLTAPGTETRIASAHLLKGLWDSGTDKQSAVVLETVMTMAGAEIHRFGVAALQLVYLVLYLIQGTRRTPLPPSLLEPLMQNLTLAAGKAVETIQGHENGTIYRYIQKMLGTEREDPDESRPAFVCCLDRVPCGICVSDVGEQYAMRGIGEVREETKYTESAHIVRLKGALSIQKVLMEVTWRGSRYIKAINFYTTSAKTADFDELKKNWGLWRKAGTLTAKYDDHIASLEFPIPVTASIVMFEFVSVPADSQQKQPVPEGMVCPGCNQPVTSVTGICGNCGENAYQCPKCHSINYNKPDAFVCTECGASRYEKFDLRLSVRTGTATEKIESEREKTAVQKDLSNAMEKAMNLHETIRRSRDRLAAIISSTPVKSAMDTSGRYIEVYSTYMNRCIPDYQSLVQQLKSISAMKTELLLYANQPAGSLESMSLAPSNNCYSCAESYCEIFVRFVEMASSVGNTADILHRCNVPVLLLSRMLPLASPTVAKRIIKCFVALSLQSSQFAEEVFVRAERMIKEIEAATPERTELVLSVELLLQLHSRAVRLMILHKAEPGGKYQQKLLGRVTAELYRMLMSGVKSAQKKLVCAEEVAQPILDYLADLLSILPAAVDIVVLALRLTIIA